MEVSVNFKGGGSFVDLKPKFSSDGGSLYVCFNDSLTCYNTKTGKLVTEFKGITERIIGFEVYNLGGYDFLMACLKTGEIIEWKAETRFRLRTKKIGVENVRSFHLLPIESEDDLKVLVSYTVNNHPKFCVVNLASNKITKWKLKLKNSKYSVATGKNYYCVAQGLQVWFIKTETQEVFKHLVTRDITTLACHPEQEIVLVGDADGRVVMWQDIFSETPSKAVYHWHTLPARCVSFSTAGTHFYSGGEESVLVRWQLNTNLEKKFLPRLPSTIVHVCVSPDNTRLAIATADNGIRIIDPLFNSISLIQHLVVGNHFDCGIVFDPRTKTLVMNGNVGQVQFYNPQDMSLLYKLDIVDQNKVTNERNCVIENTQITKIAMNKTGMWLATVEERKDEQYTPEIRLKFWNFNAEKQNFELNSSIEFPHEKSITNIMFRPTSSNEELKCVTVGQDCKYRIWELTDVDSIYRKGKLWRGVGEGFYRSLPCKGLSFAIDGSLLAVGFGPIVTTWLPDTCEHKCSLTHPSHLDHVEHIAFGSGNLCHLIVSTTSQELRVWNLLTLSVVWKVWLDVSLLITDNITTNMAVITKDNKVFVFSPMEPTPIFSSNKLLKDHKRILTAAFVPSKYSNDVRLKWHQRSYIFFIDRNRELYSISGEEEYPESTQEMEDKSSSLLSVIFAKCQMNANKLPTPAKHMYEKDIRHTTVKKYLDSPIHTMVPIRLSCKSILQSLVIQKNNTVM